jgi:GPH family glycoside/pentoside/hexuronide:cation symporter
MNKLSESNVLQFAFFGAVSALILTVPSSLASFYLINDLAVNLAYAGVVLSVIAVLENLIRILSGVIIQKANMRWGKYRSWIVVLRWVIVFGSIVLFINTGAMPVFVRIFVFAFGYLALYASLTITQTAHYMLITKMAGTNMKDRIRLSVRNTQFVAFAPIVSAYIFMPGVEWVATLSTKTQPMIYLNMVMAVIFVIGAYVLTKVAKPYDAPQSTAANATLPKVTISDLLSSVFTNKPLLSVLFANVFLYTAVSISAGTMIYYFFYIDGNMELMRTTVAASMFTGLVASLIAPKIGMILGKKKAMVFGLLIYALSNIAIIFLARNFTIIFIVLLCLNAGVLFLFKGFHVLYVLDSAEYHYWKTGKDHRAVAVSLIDFPIKIGVALAASITAFIVQSVGFSPEVAIEAEAIRSFLLLFGGIPAICALIGALIMHVGYEITDEDAERYVRENAEKSAHTQNVAEQIS